MKEVHIKLVKSALGVRASTSNHITLIESRILHIKALIRSRQLNYFRNFTTSLQIGSVRKDIFTELLSEPSSYLNYYVELDQKYICSKNIYEEFTTTLRNNVLRKNDETHYRFFVYMHINPTLDQSPFMMMPGNLPLACTKFRLWW